MTGAPPATGNSKHHLAIAAAGILFGTTFLVVKDAVDEVGPIPFIAVRFSLGALVMAVPAVRRSSSPGLLRAGAACGLALGAGYLFQTIGLQYTTASVSAFVTYLLVVMVPVISAVMLRRRPDAPTIAGVVLALVGMALLTGGVDGIGKGELLTFGCAVAFAVHVILLASYSPRFDTWQLNAVQLAIVGALCAVPGLFTGGYRFTPGAWAAAAYTAVAVSAGALGLQMWGQRAVSPTRTSLILMIEPVSAALLGVVAGERLGLVGAIGAGLILGGIAVAEVPALRRGG